LIVDTRRLFLRLLRTLEVETVCDVGSMDGHDALSFRRRLPAANIIALEPNPRNFVLMQADERFRRQCIRVLPLAASDRDSEAPFFLVKAEYALNRDRPRRGMSSLHRRPGSLPADVVQVRTVRLDNLLAAEGCAGKRVALWVDTEGMAFEAIAGASGLLDRTQMLHVEVETVACIGATQRLFPDVERLLVDAGFGVLATDQPRTSMQFNALFVRAEILRAKAAEIRLHATTARLQRILKRSLRRLLPWPLRRLLVSTFDTTRTH
jgi:FkbM family methyltransferase